MSFKAEIVTENGHVFKVKGGYLIILGDKYFTAEEAAKCGTVYKVQNKFHQNTGSNAHQ